MGSGISPEQIEAMEFGFVLVVMTSPQQINKSATYKSHNKKYNKPQQNRINEMEFGQSLTGLRCHSCHFLRSVV